MCVYFLLLYTYLHLICSFFFFYYMYYCFLNEVSWTPQCLITVDLKIFASFRILGFLSEKFLNMCLTLYQIVDSKLTDTAQTTCKYSLKLGLLRADGEKKTLKSVYGKSDNHRSLFLREING